MRTILLKAKILHPTFLILLPPKRNKEDGKQSNSFSVNPSIPKLPCSFSCYSYRNVNGIDESNKICGCFVEGNETFEKLASMSLIANLIVYMHTQYNIENANSVEVFNIWSGFTNFLPLVGAYVADAYVGKFNMLLFGSIASLLVYIYI